MSNPAPAPPTLHASCLLVGEAGVLVRGPSGAGKSRLVLRALRAGALGRHPTRLVADDRVHLTAAAGRLIARVPPAIAGLIEQRGLGPVALPHTPAAVIRLVLDLDADDAARLPPPEALTATLQGLVVPRLPVAPFTDPFDVLASYFQGDAQGRETG